MRVVFAIFAALAVLAVSAFPAQAGGDAGTIRAGHYTAEVGEQVTVVLQAVDIPEPGLGAWSVDVIYDSAIVHATACTSEQGGVCSPAFSDDTVRVTGAVVTEGLTGNFPLATFTFTCDVVGTSKLEVEEVLFTTAEPQLEIDDLSLDNGSITCEEPGQGSLIRIGSLEMEAGLHGVLVLEVEDVPKPGLGAWQVDVTYDPEIVSARDCVAEWGGVCNIEYSEDTVRVAGASATGLRGDFALAGIEFRCLQPGTTELSVSLSIFGSGIPEDYRPVRDVENGMLTCIAPRAPVELPSTGGGTPQQGSPAATVPLAALGAVLVAAAFGIRRYARD